MSPALITKLVGIEYELASLQGTLKDLATEIRQTGVDGAHQSSKDLLLARKFIRRALRRLDEPLTVAAVSREMLETPPF